TEIYTLSLHDALPIYIRYYRLFPGCPKSTLKIDTIEPPDAGGQHCSGNHPYTEAPCRLACRAASADSNPQTIIIGIRPITSAGFQVCPSLQRYATAVLRL